MVIAQRDSFIEQVAQDIAGDKEAVEKLRQQDRDADRLAFRRALGLPDEAGLTPPPAFRQPPVARVGGLGLKARPEGEPAAGQDAGRFFYPQEELFPVSEKITAIRPITGLPPGFKMPVGELRPIVAYQSGRTRVPSERATEEQKQTWTPVFEDKLPEPREGIGYALDILTGRPTTENPKGLTPIEYARQFPASEAAITWIPVIATLGVTAYQGIPSLIALTKQIPDKILQTALNTGLDRWIAQRSRGVPPQSFKQAQDMLYNLLAKDRAWLQQRATDNMLRRMGRGVNQATAARQAADDVVTDFEARMSTLVPRGTQTGAMAFGGATGEPVPPTILNVAAKIARGVQLTPQEEQFRLNNKEEVETALRANAPVTEAPPPVTPEVTVRRFISSEKVTEVTQARTAPWRISYEYKGKEYARHFPSREKAVVWAREKLGLELDPKTLQPIPATEVTPAPEVTIPEKPPMVAQPSQRWDDMSTTARVKIIQSIPTDERIKVGLTTADANLSSRSLSPEKKAVIAKSLTPTVTPTAPAVEIPKTRAEIQARERLTEAEMFEKGARAEREARLAKVTPAPEVREEAEVRREQMRKDLMSQEDTIKQEIMKEIRSYKPLGKMSEVGEVLGVRPTRGQLVSTPFGSYVFAKARLPDAQTIKRWEDRYKEAEELGRRVATETSFIVVGTGRTTGNIRELEQGRRLKAQGLLSPRELKYVDALEEFWAKYPDADYGVVQPDGSIKPSTRFKPKPVTPTAPAVEIPKGVAVKPEVTEEEYSGKYYRTEMAGIPQSGVKFFTKNRDYAEELLGLRGKGIIREENLQLKNPLVVEATTKQFSDPTFEKEYIDKALMAGNDAVVFVDKVNDDIFVAQIPSAIPAAKPVTPTAPAVEITAEMIPAGQIPTLETWDKMSIPEKGKIVERLGLSRRLGSASFTEFVAAVREIPKAEAAQTWTEAGIQPSMLPEEVAAIEVRPPVKGKITQISMDDQLKLEQAREAAVRAEIEGTEAKEAYQAQWMLEALQAVHQVDPVAQWRTTETVTRKTKQPDGSYKLTQHQRKVGLDSFIPIGETEFPETLTVKQARMIWPEADYSRWLQKGTRGYNKVPRDVALDPIASELGFTDTTAVNDLAARINQIRGEKRQLQEASDTIKREMTERPLPAVLELTSEEVAEQWQMLGQPRYNLKQIDGLVGPFAEYIMSPNTVNAYELARQTLALQRSERFENLKDKLAEMKVQTGEVTEEQTRQIITDTLSGKYWVEMSDYLQFITGELRDAHFAKVAHVLKDYPAEYAGTITALVNALDGRPIPNVRPTPPPGGFKSLLWPQGASALDKLQYVFGKGTRHMKALEKMAAEKKPLDEVVEGIFRETGQAPIPIDPKDFDYLESLPTWAMKQTLGLDVPGPRVRFTYDPTGKLGLSVQGQQLQFGEQGYQQYKSSIPGKTPEEDLRSVLELDLISNEVPEDVRNVVLGVFDKQGLDAAFDRLGIEMASSPQAIAPTKYKYDAPIENAFKQGQLWPRPVRDNIIRALKELGMLPVDIGNFLRANKASVDFSFWRQQAPLIASHPISFAQANVEAWRALWSQKSAEASWERITRDPLYQIYEEAAARGGDFLRPLILPKGTAQYRGTEEYGYSKGVERLLPKFTAKLPWVKLSARAFETGTNVHNWLIFKSYYSSMLKLAEMYASGQKKLKAGEAFDIEKEMSDFAKSLGNFTGRGSLGKFAATAPELSGLFFAPRLAVGRILSVTDLVNANPKVRLEAWKNASLFVGTFGGIILLGAAMDWWEIETDPRSAEYMSIRIGNTRIDPWGGFRQFLVFFARAITQTGVSSVTGAEYEVDPINLIQTFIRGKASPLSSLIFDFWRGKTFIGEEVDVANKRQWAERVAPFAVWDIYEAYKDDPIHAIQAAIPAIVGAGVQTYTGDWKENFPKLGLPKYSENLAYGLTEPKYDTADFWSDTASQFKGVDPTTLTKEKGFPDYIRAIVEAKKIQEHLSILPSEKLVNLNADPTKGATFTDYFKMWRDREVIVASGDEEKLKAFDQDERTRNANLGNFSQRQFALLNDYWSITSKTKREAFLEEHKTEIGVKPRDEYLKTHPKENAELAVWDQAKILTDKAYEEFKKLNTQLDIPESAISLDVERTEADLKLLRYWELPSSPASIRRSYRAAHPEIDAMLVKWYDYTPVAPQRATTTPQGKGLDEDEYESLIKRMAGGE